VAWLKAIFCLGALLGAGLAFALSIPAPGADIPKPPATLTPLHDMSPAKGRILVARRGMLDPRFRESVVLLLEHGDQGSMGLIINHASELRLKNILPHVKGISRLDDVLYFGGPVATSVAMVLYRHERALPESARATRDLFYSASQVTLESLLKEDQVSRERMRVFFGHANWYAGQLLAELGRGDWYLFESSPELVFSIPAEFLWQVLINRARPAGLQAGYACSFTGLRSWRRLPVGPVCIPPLSAQTLAGDLVNIPG
jgi:putative transcriptional regulator